MNEQKHTSWTLPLMKAVAKAIFDDRNLNPGKDTTKALVEEITREINLPMTPAAKKMIWSIVQDIHQSQIIEGRALKAPQAHIPVDAAA